MRPVYVASRGRPAAATLRALRAAGIAHVAVVEPHERHDYLAAGAARTQLETLPDSGRGLAYVRQWILDDARERGYEWYWMLDDDITALLLRFGKRMVRANTWLAALDRAEEQLAAETWGQAALEYQQYAWSAAADLAWNSYADVAVAIRTDVTAEFRAEAGLKVDRDFTLQLITGGRDVVRTTRVAFAAPTMGTNDGGLRDEYLAGRERADSEWMAAAWPGLASVVVKPDGRVDAKIDWKQAAAVAR